MNRPPRSAPRRPRVRRTLVAGIVAVVALLAGSCGGGDGGGDPTDAGAAPVTAPGAVVPTADGGQLDFGDLEGSPALLWFWAPW